MNILEVATREIVNIGTIENKKYFHIALTGTDNYVPYIGIAMMSMYANNPSFPMMFHLFLNDISSEDKERMKTLVKKWGGVVVLHLMNDDAFKSLISKDKSSVFFYRFVIADLLKGQAERVLYIDGDVMCNGPLEVLDSIDFENHVAGVITDRFQLKQMKRHGTQAFFNAGVMLINIDEWCQQKIMQKCISLAHQFIEESKTKHVRYDDQIILNKILNGKTLYLPIKYNYLYNLSHRRVYQKEIKNKSYKEQVILHFAGHIKPWHSWVGYKDVVKEYLSIKKQSPWADLPLSEASTHKLKHQLAREYRSQGKYIQMVGAYFRYFKARF